MALKQKTSTRRGALETNGPTMADDPSGPNPPNPSDAIFMGRPLPVVIPRDQVTRRPFTIPIKPTLRWSEGLDGAAETVANRRVANQDLYVDNDQDHSSGNVERGVNLGPDTVKAKNGIDCNEFTERGEWIRGT